MHVGKFPTCAFLLPDIKCKCNYCRSKTFLRLLPPSTPLVHCPALRHRCYTRAGQVLRPHLRSGWISPCSWSRPASSARTLSPPPYSGLRVKQRTAPSARLIKTVIKNMRSESKGKEHLSYSEDLDLGSGVVQTHRAIRLTKPRLACDRPGEYPGCSDTENRDAAERHLH